MLKQINIQARASKSGVRFMKSVTVVLFDALDSISEGKIGEEKVAQ